MGIGKLSEKVSELSDAIPYYFFCLFFSCISFSVAIIVFSGEISWLRPLPVIIYSFYVVIPYLLFAVPLQITFNKHPRKFNVFYLLIYTVLSLVAVILFNVILFEREPTYLVKTQIYYGLSFAAAAIYWFWDSVFLQKKIS
ncbi:UPF0715 family protein [Peribacillus sp. TH24]|uniref:UPF0715 family protein n=1 Tax=Peribacillus sp. TH24 TaxID=2798483 RepID=UPI001914B205|nr:UPF0715 family protein [Peribacillus sp. TH24]MBK5443341.1 UPF0715 family protein [Peribacillus sp. TH24]